MYDLESRFTGSLLGLALGDALGAPHEGGPLGQGLWWLLGLGKGKLLRWTDDTEMAVGLATSLAEKGGLDADHLALTWAGNADWKRGYGAGAGKILARIRNGEDWRMANRSVFPGGSYGNGAAMRAAPLGLFFHRRPDELIRATDLASSITHAHPLGMEGGRLIARATAMAIQGEVDLETLRRDCAEERFRDLLEIAKRPLEAHEVRRELGVGVEAQRSVVTAIHVARRFIEFLPMIEFVISLGGDTDTIGAMAGGIFGARHGRSVLPPDLIERLEDREDIELSARKLHAAWRTTE